MAQAIITQNGLDFVTSAFDQGTLIAVKYWIPVYDYRIDPTIRSNTQSLSAISAVMVDTVGLTQPVGEAIWNISGGYALSDTTSYEWIISASNDAGTGDTRVSTKQTAGPVAINLSANTTYPLSPYYRGDSIYSSAAGTWVFTNISAVSGLNNSLSDYTDKTKMFRVMDYMSVIESGQTEAKGKFFCKLSENIGTVKFNKIALYAAQYDGDVEGPIAFFAEAYLNSPIKKSYFGDGYNLLTFEVLLTLSSTGGAGNNIWYGTSADYWNRVPNGQHSPEKISVGNFEAWNSEPQTTVHIGKVYSSASTSAYSDEPQLRIEDQNSFGYDTIVSGIDDGPEGQYSVEIVYGLSKETLYGDTLTIRPKTSAFNFNFGTTACPITQQIFTGETDVSADYLNTTIIQTKEAYLALQRHRLYFYDGSDDGSIPVTPPNATKGNSIYGVDIVRNQNDLLVQTRFKNIYIIAGASNQANSIDDSMNRHNYNISDVETSKWYPNTEATNPLSSTNWVFSAETYIVARGGVNVFGPLELNYVAHAADSWPYAVNYGVLSTKKKYMSIMTGFKKPHDLSNPLSLATYQDIYDYILHSNLNNTTNWTPIGQYINSDSVLFIQAGTIKTWGNIEPGLSGSFDFGSSTKPWNDIYSNSLQLTRNRDSESTMYGMIISNDYNSIDDISTVRIRKYQPNDKIYIGSFPDGQPYPVTEIQTKKINIENRFFASDSAEEPNVIIPAFTSTTASIINLSVNTLNTAYLNTTQNYNSVDSLGAGHNLKWYVIDMAASAISAEASAIPFSSIIGFTAIVEQATNQWWLSDLSLKPYLYISQSSGGKVKINKIYPGRTKVIIFYQS